MKNLKIIQTNSNKLGKYDAHFLEKLAVLLNGGFNLRHALLFLLEQYDVIKEGTRTDAIQLINEGTSLSQLLKFLGFRKSVIVQVEFAEIHGEVEKNLLDSSNYITYRRTTIKKFLKAVQYPLILISIFIGMLIILNYTVIPQFKTLYSAMGTEAEGLVYTLTLFLEHLPTVVFVFTGITLCGFSCILVILKLPDVEKQCRLLLNIPFIRFYFINYHTFHFSREFGYFINNGLEIKEIINIFKVQDLDKYLSYAARLIEEELLSGHSLSEAVGKVPFIDDRLCTFINHGKYSSSVAKELLLFSEYTLEKLIMRTENMTRRIQPVIFLILGLLIICLYLIIVLPIFDMMSQIH